MTTFNASNGTANKSVMDDQSDRDEKRRFHREQSGMSYTDLMVQLKCLGVLAKSFLSDKQFERLIDRIEYRSYGKNEYVCRKGETTEAALYLVVSGKAWLQRDLAANKSPALMPSGCNFGEEMLSAAEFKQEDADSKKRDRQEGLEVEAPYSVWGATGGERDRDRERLRCAVLTMKSCREVFDIDRAEKQRDADISRFSRPLVPQYEGSRSAAADPTPSTPVTPRRKLKKKVHRDDESVSSSSSPRRKVKKKTGSGSSSDEGGPPPTPTRRKKKKSKDGDDSSVASASPSPRKKKTSSPSSGDDKAKKKRPVKKDADAEEVPPAAAAVPAESDTTADARDEPAAGKQLDSVAEDSEEDQQVVAEPPPPREEEETDKEEEEEEIRMAPKCIIDPMRPTVIRGHSCDSDVREAADAIRRGKKKPAKSDGDDDDDDDDDDESTPPPPQPPAAAVENSHISASSARSKFESRIRHNQEEHEKERAWHSPAGGRTKPKAGSAAIPQSPRSPPVAPASPARSPGRLSPAKISPTKKPDEGGGTGEPAVAEDETDRSEDIVKLDLVEEDKHQQQQQQQQPLLAQSPVQAARSLFERGCGGSPGISSYSSPSQHRGGSPAVKKTPSPEKDLPPPPTLAAESPKRSGSPEGKPKKKLTLPPPSPKSSSDKKKKPSSSSDKSMKQSHHSTHSSTSHRSRSGSKDKKPSSSSSSKKPRGSSISSNSSKSRSAGDSASVLAARKTFDSHSCSGKIKRKPPPDAERSSKDKHKSKSKPSSSSPSDIPPRPPKNIFQDKIKLPPDYKPPVYPKKKEEEVKIKVAMDNRSLLKHIPEKSVGSLTAAFEKRKLTAGSEIVRQGTVDDCYYVVSKGECEYEIDGVRQPELVVKEGDSFGEEALVTRSVRAASIYAKTDTEVFKLDQTTYRSLLEKDVQQHDKHKRELLTKVDFLQNVHGDNMQKLVSLMLPKNFRKGETIARREDFDKAFYIIDDGEVACRGGEQEGEEKLGAGQSFGQQALMEVNQKMKCSDVVATKAGTLYKIDRDDYRQAVGTSCDLMPIESRTLLNIEELRRKWDRRLKESDLLKLSNRIQNRVYAAGEVIIEQDCPTEGAIYFLRQGDAYSTQGESAATRGRFMTVLAVGSQFGLELFASAKEAKRVLGTSPYRVVAKGDCVCGVLTIKDYYEAFGVKPKRSKPADSKAKPKATTQIEEVKQDEPSDEPAWPKVDVPLSDLERRVCLGEGNFGQVWLAVDKTSKNPEPYVLKIQSKYFLVSEGEAEVCIQEKQILAQLDHPFIVDLVNAFQDEAFVYMMLEFVQGGELFTVMNPWDRIMLSESHAKFYALGIADAFAYMHARKFVYRDLKPENVLIDSMGYPKLIDFGFAKLVTDKTFTLCGTPGYLAPEVVLNRGHNASADHWQLGVLIYEMISLQSPYFDEGIEQMELYRCVVEDPVPEMDTGCSPEVWNLIKRLLMKDPTHRLGSLARGERDILHHRWFNDISLIKLQQRQLPAPWVPKIKDPLDTSNFDDWSELEDVTLDVGQKLSAKQARMFDDF